jgi:hypothetical protein
MGPNAMRVMMDGAGCGGGDGQACMAVMGSHSRSPCCFSCVGGGGEVRKVHRVG